MHRQELTDRIHFYQQVTKRLERHNHYLRQQAAPFLKSWQKKQLRFILHGHTIDAAKLLEFDPHRFITDSGHVDEPALVWWLHNNGAQFDP